jgi:hypothetical protein
MSASRGGECAGRRFVHEAIGVAAASPDVLVPEGQLGNTPEALGGPGSGDPCPHLMVLNCQGVERELREPKLVTTLAPRVFGVHPGQPPQTAARAKALAVT